MSLGLRRSTRSLTLVTVLALGGLTACGSGDSDADAGPTSTTTPTPQALAAADRYRTYVLGQTSELVQRTEAFAAAVKAGDVNKAKELYASTRAPYERIEPVAEVFGDLDPAIDERADDKPIADVSGFHRIEHALWVDNTTTGMAPVADKLVADVRALHDRIPTVQLDVVGMANGANELLSEVSQSKVTGEEERYSHTDLWDFDANVSGSRAAIDALRPVLDESDAAAGKVIDERFDAVDKALAPFRSGAGFVSYQQLTKDDVKKLSQSIDALAEPISEVAGKVAGNTK